MCILFLYHALDSQDGAHEPLSLAFRPGKAAKGLGGRYKLIIASNRDEFMDRPTEGMHFWSDKGSNVLAGRDLHGGGTWLGVSRCGKFATVTNVKSAWESVLRLAQTRVRSLAVASTAMLAGAVAMEVARRRSEREGGWLGVVGLMCAGLLTASLSVVSAVRVAKQRSRGSLVSQFLQGDKNAEEFCRSLAKELWRYDGFNLVLADSSGAWVVSNRDRAGVTRLPRGSYAVSNATLEVPWPKLLHGKSRFMDVLLRVSSDPKFTEDALVDLLMKLLGDETCCWPPATQPWRQKGGANRELESVCVPPKKIMGSMFSIIPEEYGTRSSTVVLVDVSGRIKVVDRNLDGGGATKMVDEKRSTFEFCDI